MVRDSTWFYTTINPDDFKNDWPEQYGNQVEVFVEGWFLEDAETGRAFLDNMRVIVEPSRTNIMSALTDSTFSYFEENLNKSKEWVNTYERF